MPNDLSADYDTLRAFWDAAPDTWGFWARWYDGMLRGAPLDWELQRAIALIDDRVWDEGPEAVAREIAKIEARFDLQARIAELEAELARASQDRHGIGGNNPPERIESAPQIARDLIVVWAPLQDLNEEAANPEPDMARVKRLVAALTTALQEGLLWAASKADLAVDTTIKWGIPAAGGYFVLNPDKLEAVIAAANRWLSLLP